MMIRIRIKRLCILLFFWSLLSSFSTDMRFRKINMSTGLSHNSVLCVAEDHENLIWIGTREGLNKYNSVDVTIYKQGIHDSTSLSNNHVICIYENHQNELWVGTARGVNRYDRINDRFVAYLPGNDSSDISNGYVRCITDGFNGKTWIGTSAGLNIYNPETNSFKKIYLEENPTLDNNIIALLHDRQDKIWIGTKGGLYVYEQEQFHEVPLQLDTNVPFHPIEIRDIKEDDQGAIWIATEEHGIFSINYRNGKASVRQHFHTKNSAIISNAVRKFLIDGDNIWLATLEGLSILNKATGEMITVDYSVENPEGISNSSLHDIIKDHAGGCWLATYTGGVNYYHPQNNLFPHFQKVVGAKNTLSSDAVSGFIEDKDGNLFIGTGDGGLNYKDQATGKIIAYTAGGKNDISNNNIKSIDKDQDGNLWIGTYNGLNFFDRETEHFHHYFFNPNDSNSLNNNQVHVVHVDEDGLVWIGMNGGTFQVFDPKTEKFTSLPQVGRIVTEVLFEDSHGKLWIGERYGLKCLDRKTRQLVDISHFTIGYEDQLCYLNWITEDDEGRIWLATQSAGMILFKDGHSYLFDDENGLNDNTVNAILEDDLGDFWISTNKGISKINYSEDKQGIPHLKSTNFTTIHGLQGAQFEQGSAYKSPSGKLYFGGINGYNAFMPADVVKKDYFPPVTFTELQINFKTNSPTIPESVFKISINEADKIELKYSQRNIFLRFAGINFVNPHDTYYRYMLSGLDQDWVELGDQRTLNFTYLPIGEHELLVQSSTNPDKWNDGYRSLMVKIDPPWWLTYWAFLLYIVLLSALLYAFFMYSQRWADLKNKLNMEQFQREKELELHESKLKFFTDVSHELRTPLTLILAPLEKIMLQKDVSEKLNRQLQVIQRNGHRMMQLIDQVLNLRKLETGHEKLQAAQGDIVSFLKEISLAFAEIASSKNIQFNYHTNLPKLDLWYDRDKMEIIIYNLLSNAIKNTAEGGTITLSLSIENESLTGDLKLQKGKMHYAKIRVEDTGRGISEADLAQIFDRFYSTDEKENQSIKGIGVGLELTKRMVKLHKGEIEVESEQQVPGKEGFTRFSILLPLGSKHLSGTEKLVDFKNSEDPSRYTHEIKLREKLGNLVPEQADIELPKISDKDKQTLLIVEDNPDVRTFVRDLFHENYLVEEAADGLQGWKLAIEIIPDLIISDIMMPEMDGIELCRKLKSDVRTSHIPVILLTARTTLTFKYEGLETGADEYITKPFSAQYLMLKVKNLIKQRNLLRQHFERESILQPEDITVTSVDERLLKKAVDYIVENIENPSISVEKLSQELGLSRVHFYRKIKALTNLTAVEFIRSIRLKRAAAILIQAKLSVKEVQNKVGFESADYFRKCFKAQFSVTPSEYAAQKGSKSDEIEIP